MLLDVVISTREKVLSHLIGSHQALNDFPGAAPCKRDVSVELPQALNALRRAELEVNSTQVDYDRVRRGMSYAAYHIYSTGLKAFNPVTLPSREHRLAFWINLYNVLVIHAVIAFGVRRSVAEERAGLAFFRRAAYDVGGQFLSCDDIEHGILRANHGHPLIPGPQFGPSDPRQAWVISPMDIRVHFALNCASRSCPPINVYEADKIDTQLDLATRNFINTEVTVNPSRNEVHLSRIFRWYRKDFGGPKGIIGFLLRYLADGEQRDWLQGKGSPRSRANSIRLVYRPYDWALNSPT